MGRHKFEDQFREKLTQREITPSSSSWEKLSGQLDSAEKKKGQKSCYLFHDCKKLVITNLSLCPGI